jgi:hypothetical protein
MNKSITTSVDREQADEELFSPVISDEALEAAAGPGPMPPSRQQPCQP